MRGYEAEYEDENLKRLLKAKIPMERLGEPAELVGAAIYFLSNASTYCTGQYLAIDGGYLLV